MLRPFAHGLQAKAIVCYSDMLHFWTTIQYVNFLCTRIVLNRFLAFSGQKLRTFKLSACYIDSMEYLSKVLLVTVFGKLIM